jgi:hypothetical protein
VKSSSIPSAPAILSVRLLMKSRKVRDEFVSVKSFPDGVNPVKRSPLTDEESWREEGVNSQART